LEYAVLGTEAAIVGTGEYFEIWNPDDWAEELLSVTDPETNAGRFASFDLSSE
jgi:DNA-binding transcriptional regulator/RsmH inhibitor MraZ